MKEQLRAAAYARIAVINLEDFVTTQIAATELIEMADDLQLELLGPPRHYGEGYAVASISPSGVAAVIVRGSCRPAIRIPAPA